MVANKVGIEAAGGRGNGRASMFRTIVISGFLAATLACGLSFAQTPDEDSPPGDYRAPSAAAPAMRSGSSARQLIASCRSQARAKGLRGEQFRSALDECVGAQRPKVAARLHCRQEGRAQGASGDELREYVRNCASHGGMARDDARPRQESAPSADIGLAPDASQNGAPQEEASQDRAPQEGPQQDEAMQEGPMQDGAPPAMDRSQPARELIAHCRSDARAKGLSGDALQSAVSDCVGAQQPRVAARLQCRQQGKAQGVAGDELRAFVRSCVAQR
jgi:hypothetical protein